MRGRGVVGGKTGEGRGGLAPSGVKPGGGFAL